MLSENILLVMEILKNAWPVVLLVAAPIGALIGFIVHAFTIRKANLEIEKLRYEIERMKSEKAVREGTIKIADFDQTLKFSTNKHYRRQIDKEWSQLRVPRSLDIHQGRPLLGIIIWIIVIGVIIWKVFF